MPHSLDLNPGDSLGPFQLGSLLFNVLNHIRSYRDLYPSCKLSWHDTSPSSTPIHLTLSTPPLTLSFDSLSQRLSRIQLDAKHASPSNWVTYRGKRLTIDQQEEEQDIVRVVRRVFGPTYGSSRVKGKGEDEEEEEEMLSYPGVALGVTKQQSGSTRGSRLNRIILTPLPSPPNIPVDQAWLHPILSSSPSIASGDLKLAEIILDPTSLKPCSITLHFHSAAEEEVGPVELRIGETTSEDIICELGNAVRSFWKEDDRMSIHTSHSTSPDPSLSLNPYFLSYPSLGLTLLLSPPSTPTSPTLLIKVILHSNLPGQVNFGRTSRCAWSVTLRSRSPEAEEATTSIGGEEGFARVREVLRGSSKGGRKEEGVSRGENSVGGGSAIPTSNSSSKKKKNKSGNQTKEIDLLGSSLSSLDSPVSSSPASSSVPRVPSPLSRQYGEDYGEMGGRQEEAEMEEEKPMILDRTAFGSDVGGGSEGRGKTTEIHGFDGIAFEVTSEGDIETVWLF